MYRLVLILQGTAQQVTQDSGAIDQVGALTWQAFHMLFAFVRRSSGTELCWVDW